MSQLNYYTPEGLKKLKDDHDTMLEKLDNLQSTRDQILQRIGGVEARAERNEIRMDTILDFQPAMLTCNNSK